MAKQIPPHRFRSLSISLLILSLVGVAAPLLGAEEDNRLSSDEESAGWRLLFDGRSLEAWRGFRLQGLPAGWSVVDGEIRFARPESGPRADLVTREEFENFELSLEWAVAEGGNSGIFFRVSEARERTYETGPEMQILDDDGHRDGERAITSAASNYALHPPNRDVLRPVGEFNRVLLRVQGDRVEHWLNGVQVVEYRLWSDDWKSRVAASKFAAMPGYGLERSGHIALQDHGDPVRFRNLKIRRLP